MNTKRKVEVFSAGCPRIACRDDEVKVLDMNDSEVAKQAKSLGIQSIPAIVIDGKLADCCEGRGPDELSLKAAGLGQPLPSNV